MDLSQYIRDVPDFPKPGILFKDITPLLNHPPAFREAIRLLAEPFKNNPPDAIAAAEARGFLFAAPLALVLDRPLVPLRKPGKLPYHTYRLEYELEYGQAELQVHTDGFVSGARVMIVDDLLATGGTLKAACQLVEQARGKVLSCAVLVELLFLKGRERLRPYTVTSLLQF